ncbi:MAG: hypothetical protein AB7O89_05335, partial [Parachlamydiales bacterium]
KEAEGYLVQFLIMTASPWMLAHIFSNILSSDPMDHRNLKRSASFAKYQEPGAFLQIRASFLSVGA